MPPPYVTAPRPRYRQDKDWELSVVGVLPICGSGAGGEAPADQKPHRKYASVMVPSDTPERWPVRLADVTVVFDERSAPRKFARSYSSFVATTGNGGYPGRQLQDVGLQPLGRGDRLSRSLTRRGRMHAPPWGGTGPQIL